MTNTHSIEELKNIEIALSNLVKLSHGNESIGGLIQMVHCKFKDCQSDIITSLIVQDIASAEREGTLISDNQKTLLVTGAITADQIITANRNLAS